MNKKETFKYQPPIVSEMVIFLIGDFNSWNPTKHRLSENGGVYEISLQLAPGEYKYQFLINDRVLLDPTAETIVVDDIAYSLRRVSSAEEFVYLVPFRIKDKSHYEEISVVGDFNQWKPNYNRLQRKGKYFQTSLFLTDGSFQYKYLAKDNRWFNEQEIKAGTDKLVSDNSSKNSLLSPGNKYSYAINKDLISTINSNKLQFKQDIIKIYRYDENHFEFKAILPELTNIIVKLSLNQQVYELDFIASDGINCAFSKTIELTNIDFIYTYKLIINGKNTELYANIDTLSNNQQICSTLVPSGIEIFAHSRDLSHRVMYQIMPDRFCNGDPSLNPNFKEAYYSNTKIKPVLGSLAHNQEYYHLAKWNEIDMLTQNPYSQDKEPDWFVFYGGDLTGVRSKIPYLTDLGISLIYFNPVFQAKSPHRYDTIDFKCIDPHLGTNEAFQDLVEELHKNDIKVIIDIALNHCGFDFFAFTDTIKNGDKSEYWSWFDWKKWPLPSKLDKKFTAEEYYQCWWGIKDLPEFNYDLFRKSPEENKISDIKEAKPNAQLINYLLESMKYWVETIKIDGFRLDVPEEVPFWFWKLFRRMLKNYNPEIYIVGEIWNSAKDWLQGEYFDAIMNYESFKDPVIAYFFQNKLSLTAFKNSISSGLVHLPELVTKSQMNLLGSHDTIRIRRLAGEGVDKLKLALIFQFTFIGIPHIYYGDEVFLDGNKDPDNRRPFPWDFAQDSTRLEIFEFYKILIKLRRENDCFTEGKIKFRENQSLLIYERWLSGSKSKVIVIINNNDASADIEQYRKEFPKQLLANSSSNQLGQHGYYIAGC